MMINSLRIVLLLFCYFFTLISAYYNPIPTGSVIISTVKGVYFLQPKEYGGDDKLTKIFTADNRTTIAYTIFDPTPRNVHILYTNSSTEGVIYVRQLVFREQLSPIVFQLPFLINSSDVNQLISFSGDVENKRIFLVEPTGTIVLFATTGLMSANISQPTRITDPIVSVTYNNDLNRLFMISSTQLYSCSGLDTNELECCAAIQASTSLRSIVFDPSSSDTAAYVVDANAGLFRVPLNDTGCPAVPLSVANALTTKFKQAAVNGNLYFYSGSATSSTGTQDNSYLIISNGQTSRLIPIGEGIVALAIASPNQASSISNEETCFNGITYSDYRIAVILASLFGTIMGIFMCVNALFCIDFFMTKSIIRKLKRQVPHDLLEDRWNKLVEEKYAKIALEKARKRDDPPPNTRRISSAGARRTSGAATATNQPTTTAPVESLQVPNPLPKISAYLRRKSESYLSRRRSDDFRTTHDPSEGGRRNQLNVPPQVHIGPVEEENETRPPGGLRQNMSRRELLKNDEDFL